MGKPIESCSGPKVLQTSVADKVSFEHGSTTELITLCAALEAGCPPQHRHEVRLHFVTLKIKVGSWYGYTDHNSERLFRTVHWFPQSYTHHGIMHSREVLNYIVLTNVFHPRRQAGIILSYQSLNLLCKHLLSTCCVSSPSLV